MGIVKIVFSYNNGYHNNTNVKEQALIYVILINCVSICGTIKCPKLFCAYIRVDCIICFSFTAATVGFGNAALSVQENVGTYNTTLQNVMGIVDVDFYVSVMAKNGSAVGEYYLHL